MLSAFPHLTRAEFSDACLALDARFRMHGHKQHDWISCDLIEDCDAPFLRFMKELRHGVHVATIDEDEIDEDDDEVLHVDGRERAIIHYDIILSPTYRVPILYISITDPEHRYPPTIATLYDHLILPPFKAQAEHVGVIGGITITEHPCTGRTVFFIHPCRTAEVMIASVGKAEVAPEEYLLMWIGALGECVGLNVPLALMQGDEIMVDDTKMP
ncbi:hypothetical protein EK21DRAFT_97288 [Setomelanomma holmii]|uniref:Ubiquitin-like-conjugating enzyme ATG10 n=1 Tax=Setomelanomma holmii TaxID=210430 RepID=A0A9P4HK22_9PLEO|nr:hypothetical protein EK21DRAFT_97288 [Setomelanomma holmii]